MGTGGRIAEEIIFGEDSVTSGASSDIRMATNLARRMIVEWGMSSKLGFRTFEDEIRQSSKSYSSETGKLIDQEIKALLDKCYAESETLLREKIHDLHSL